MIQVCGGLMKKREYFAVLREVTERRAKREGWRASELAMTLANNQMREWPKSWRVHRHFLSAVSVEDFKTAMREKGVDV